MEYMFQQESATIEYKKSQRALSQSVFETYSAFSNTGGGTIYLGVEEDKQNGQLVYPIVGVAEPKLQRAQLLEYFADPLICSYNAASEVTIETSADGRSYIKITVAEAPNAAKPVLVVDSKTKLMKAFIRVGASDVAVYTQGPVLDVN